MIKFKGIGINLILGVLMGILFSTMIMVEGYVILASKEMRNGGLYEIKQRILVYNGSREKNTVIQIHQISLDTILVGPTLNEGIDLPGDDCRFIIISGGEYNV